FALLDRYRRRYPLSRLIVAVVGNVDPGAVAAALTSAFPAPDGPPAPAPVPPAAAPPAAATSSPPAAATSSPPAAASSSPPTGPTTVFRPTSAITSSAVVGYPTFATGDPNRLPLELLVEMLAGDGGRVAAA